MSAIDLAFINEAALTGRRNDLMPTGHPDRSVPHYALCITFGQRWRRSASSVLSSVGSDWVGGDGTPSAEAMIEMLNAAGLVHHRSKLIEDLEGQLKEGEDAGTGESAVHELVRDYGETNLVGMRDRFTHVAVRYLHHYLGRLLRQGQTGGFGGLDADILRPGPAAKSRAI